MNLIDRLLGKNSKATQIANARLDLPLPQVMRGTNFYSGIGMQDLFAQLSRRLPNSTKDWSNICGDLMLNSIVAISMDYFIRAFAEARPMVYRLVPGSENEYEKYYSRISYYYNNYFLYSRTYCTSFYIDNKYKSMIPKLLDTTLDFSFD
jgi:hypothetical protein